MSLLSEYKQKVETQADAETKEETSAHGKVKVKPLSRVQLFATPWTIAHQAPPSMGFSRPEYWSGLPFPSPGDLPDPGIEPGSPASQADALLSEPRSEPMGDSLKVKQTRSKWLSGS